MKLRSIFTAILAATIPMVMPSMSWAYNVGSLEAGVQGATGIVRTLDASLQQRAYQRSLQIQTVFDHCCINWNEGEIIASNRGAGDPVAYAIQQWVGSPPHWAIMTSARFDRIGCGASYNSAGTFYAVCLFADTDGNVAPAPPAPGTPPIVNEIPDTSMSP